MNIVKLMSLGLLLTASMAISGCSKGEKTAGAA